MLCPANRAPPRLAISAASSKFVGQRRPLDAASSKTAKAKSTVVFSGIDQLVTEFPNQFMIGVGGVAA